MSMEMTLATAVVLLRQAGLRVADSALESNAAAIDKASSRASALDAAGVLAAALGVDLSPTSPLARAFPSLLAVPVSGGHDEHITALRRARFGNALPMLARIADRVDGRLVERWALVRDVGAQVHLLDPNPWDDVAEDRLLSLSEFVVRWSLAGSQLITF
jgi:hypothetical protein